MFSPRRRERFSRLKQSTCLLQGLPSTRLQQEFQPGLFNPNNIPILKSNTGKLTLIFPNPPKDRILSDESSIVKEYMSSPRLISVYINSSLTPDEEEAVLNQPL